MDESLLAEIGGPPRVALDRLIYVVGSARGGSSITRSIIASHDNVIAMNGPSSFLNHVWRYRNKLHDRLWLQLLWTPSQVRRFPVRESLPEQRKQAFIKLLNRVQAEKRLPDLYQLYPLIRALDPDEKRDPESFLAWLDKGNDFWGVALLPKAFPKGKFVFVIRDPRGAIASLAKRHADQRSDTKFVVEPADVIVSAIYWRNLVWRQLKFAGRYPDRTIFFRFEDLTERPVEISQALFAALGLPSVPLRALERRLANLPYGASLDTHAASKGISTAPNERWKDKLDQQSLDLIAELCGASASIFGYDLRKPSRRKGFAGMVSSMPGTRAKAVTAAKLAYLALLERPSSKPGGGFPFQLINC